MSLGLPVGAGGSLAEGRVCCIELGAELFAASSVKPTIGVSTSTLIGRSTGAVFVDSNGTGGCGWLLASLGLAELVVVVIWASCGRFFGLLWLSVVTGFTRRGVGGGGCRAVCSVTADAASITGLSRREDRVAGFDGTWSVSRREMLGASSVGVSCGTIGGALTAVKVL